MYVVRVSNTQQGENQESSNLLSEGMFWVTGKCWHYLYQRWVRRPFALMSRPLSGYPHYAIYGKFPLHTS